MFYKHTYLLKVLIPLVALMASCSDDDRYIGMVPEQISPVIFNLDSLPHTNLSTYNFFEGNISNLDPVYGVLPYDLNSSLFSDYALKKRFIWMPKDSSATYINDFTSFDFPIGTILIKNFFYNDVLPNMETKLIETRLMIKREGDWTFANYEWNDTQTEAVYTSDNKFVNFDWVYKGEPKNVNYKIPGISECFTCHNKYGTPLPIGPKPQNINRDYLYENGLKNQLAKWVEQGYLKDNFPTYINSLVSWSDEAQPLDLRIRSYFDINCAHCHSEESYCEYAPMRFAFNETENLSNLGVCVESIFYINPDMSYVVKPQDIDNSALYYRLNSNQDQYKMPLIGRTLKHEEGVKLIEEWINSLSTDCE